MVEKVSIKGYDNFKEYIKDLSTEKTVNILFSSDWCPDCHEADPVIEEFLSEKELPNDLFISVDVGVREVLVYLIFIIINHTSFYNAKINICIILIYIVF